MCVCLCVCVSACVHVNSFMHAGRCARARAHMKGHMCRYTCVCVYTNTRIWTHVYARIRFCVCVNVYMRMFVVYAPCTSIIHEDRASRACGAALVHRSSPGN